MPSGTVHSSCTDQTKATASLAIVLVSRIQISGPGENNFVKWKGTFRSDRLDQIRSVSVKGLHSQGETIRACAKAGWGQCFFFLSAGRVTLLHETGFLHTRGIKIFGYKIVIEKESKKISKFSKKMILKPL